MRAFACVALILVLVACGVSTSVVMLDSAAPASDAVPPDSVLVFDGAGSVLVGYEAIAVISGSGRATGSAAAKGEDVIWALREAAAEIGADGVVLEEVLDQRRAFVGGADLTAEGAGTAIRFVPGPEEWDLAAAPRRLDEITTVAVTPVLRSDASLPDSIGLAFDEDIEGGLVDAGFRVVPSAVYDSIRRERIQEVDGLFDPFTGERFHDRALYVEQATRLELMEAYGVDGFVVPRIRPVAAEIHGSKAEWHGTSQDLVDVSEDLSGALEVAAAVVGFLAFLCSDEDRECGGGEFVEEGGVTALSLMIRLESAVGADLLTGWGGIGIAELLHPDEVPVLVPVLEDAQRNHDAVLIALEAFHRGG
jgi:hypothetical protein